MEDFPTSSVPGTPPERTPSPPPARDATPRPPPGSELAEALAQRLRDAMLLLTYRCPGAGYTPACPFGKLQGVSHASRESLLAGMDYDQLLRLFDLAAPCACPADPRRPRPL